MLKYVLSVLVVAGLSGHAAQAADTIGFREITLPDDQSGRRLTASLWYPANAAGSVTIAGENFAFFGIPAVKDAIPEAGRHPLVVISHGFGGSWRNQSWLAAELVRKGYIVASPNHPGTTTFDRRPSEAAKLWERPLDIGHVVDALVGDPALAGDIAENRIAAIGHSLGGWTVMEVAGARFDTERLKTECGTYPDMIACEFFSMFGMSDTPENRTRHLDDSRDARIKAVVSLDLGLARGFTPESLASIAAPVLILSGETDIQRIPAKLESGYLAENLPAASLRYVPIADATHFSFMQLCKPGAEALIEQEAPGESFVCKDGGKRSREAIHQQIAQEIIDFLSAALPQR
jgi:predicted dienelactone hydrolase